MRAKLPTAKRMGRPPVETLTDPQRRTLQTIREFLLTRGFPPTIQEIADERSIKGPSAYDQVNQLVRKGYLHRERRKARGITILREPKDGLAGVTSIPIVGKVAAGRPLLAESNIIGEVLVDSHLTKSGPCFALKVIGDSMVDAGIHSGDLVIVQQQPIAENGDIVIALVDGESTMKRLSIRGQQIELRPENKRHRPIPVGPESQLQIFGKVVAHRRQT